uniref:Triokinase/FMN cyclase n=1 Tax=Panagrolaimus sp. JU765 TaxID=591449 RepID=A0AC34RPY1_9BILA
MSVVKKFVNNPENCVAESLKGLVLSDPRIRFSDKNFRVLLRNDLETLRTKNVVTLISGGGSGHEPFSAGYVGKNGLSASVSGDVFASPSSEAVFQGLKEIHSPGGSIVFVINYTGDRLNFGMAVERFKAETKQQNVDLVYVDDDVALEDKTGLSVGGRGLAGSILLFQIVGFLAEVKLMKFEQLLEHSRNIIKNTGTFGVSLEPCAIPGKPRMFELQENEMELGLGIHGEPGCERTTVKNAEEVVGQILSKLTSSKRLDLKVDDEIIKNGYKKVERFVVGTGMTSIDGRGFSITILKIQDNLWKVAFDEASIISQRLTVLEPKVDSIPEDFTVPVSKEDERSVPIQGTQISENLAKRFENCLKAAANAIKSKSDDLNRLDGCGDGDCGTTLETAANAILKSIQDGKIDFQHPQTAFLQMARIFEKSVGGTTGAIYAMFFTSGSVVFENSADGKAIHDGMAKGLDAIMKYGHARPGHRTMVDPLDAAIHATNSWNSKSDWEKVVEAAEKKAEETAKMAAKSGRASYTAAEQQKMPDPGAVAVATGNKLVPGEIPEMKVLIVFVLILVSKASSDCTDSEAQNVKKCWLDYLANFGFDSVPPNEAYLEADVKFLYNNGPSGFYTQCDRVSKRNSCEAPFRKDCENTVGFMKSLNVSVSEATTYLVTDAIELWECTDGYNLTLSNYYCILQVDGVHFDQIK